jgi:hypothetical protein
MGYTVEFPPRITVACADAVITLARGDGPGA